MASRVQATRGRPRSIDKRDAIITAAGALFLARGFAQTSMDEVAREAGVSKQTVYSHFQNKDRLYSACIRNVCEEYFPQAANVAPHAAVDERLRRVGRNFLNLILSEPAINVFRTLVARASEGPRMAHLFYEAGPEVTKRTLDQIIEQGIARGELLDCNVDEASEHFACLVKGEVHFQLSLGLPVTLSDAKMTAHVASCVRVFMAAYGVGVGGASSNSGCVSGKAE